MGAVRTLSVPMKARQVVRALLTLAGAGLLIYGALAQWVEVWPGTQIDVRVLYGNLPLPVQHQFAHTAGFVMILLGTLALVGLVPRAGWLTILSGALATAGSGHFLWDMWGTTDSGSLKPGIWLCLSGGLAALVGGLFGFGLRRLRS